MELMGNHQQRFAANDERATVTDEVTVLSARENPWRETLYVAVGRNKPTRPAAEETVEGVRNAEGGRQRAWELVATLLLADVAKRAKNPKEGALPLKR